MSASVTEILGVPNRENIAFKKPYYNPSNIGGAFPLQPILKGIKREYSNARTPQQNGVAERKNRTLIEAARTILADSFLPNTFWAEAVSTACYVLNWVLVTKPQNKTPYELVTSKIPIISFIRHFRCHVTILNTIDHMGKFEGKSDEGFLVGYSLQSKAFRVYNLETKRVEENLHKTFLENKPNVAGKGLTWLFDLDYLTNSMNYQPVRLENQANKHAGPQEANQNAGTKENIDAVKSSKASEEPAKHPDIQQVDKVNQVFLDELERLKRQEQDVNDAVEALRKEFAQETKDLLLQAGAAKASSTNIVNTASTPVSIASHYGGLSFTDLATTDQDDSEIPALEEIYANPTDVKQKANGIFISQDKYVAEILKKFDFANVKTAKPDIMFAVCACSRFQVTSKVLRHLSDCHEKFRGCQFHWQETTFLLGNAKSKTFVATSTIDAEYVSLQAVDGNEGLLQKDLTEAQPTPSPIHTSEVPLVPQTDPSPTHTSEVPVEPQTDPSPRPSPLILPILMNTHLFQKVSDQAKEIQHLKAQIKKLKKQAKPVVKHHRAWMKSVSLKQRLARKRSSKKQWVHRESVSKQGRKFAKAEKKFKQLASDEEMARKVQEEWEGEEERKRLDEEEATNEALIRKYDDIKARIKL
ncbi:putative ribonuclease H-like domain-containing protein [Tanacetum coccineum]|uniref:Ribonuclease H-like domain-containing protein n=1 Tax=Tanacetum coccineum TaxID=301880 RepID=A0ABQ4WS85_9ASTR